MSFTCKRCGLTSHNENDEDHRYCGVCHIYEDELLPVTRFSQITGIQHTLYLPIAQSELDAYERRDLLLQDAFPDLPAPEREFIKSGITPEEWQQFVVSPPPIQEEDDE